MVELGNLSFVKIQEFAQVTFTKMFLNNKLFVTGLVKGNLPVHVWSKFFHHRYFSRQNFIRICHVENKNF